MSRVISPLKWVISIVIILITPLITTHEPPSRYIFSIGVPDFLNPKVARGYQKGPQRAAEFC